MGLGGTPAIRNAETDHVRKMTIPCSKSISFSCSMMIFCEMIFCHAPPMANCRLDVWHAIIMIVNHEKGFSARSFSEVVPGGI